MSSFVNGFIFGLGFVIAAKLVEGVIALVKDLKENCVMPWDDK